MKSKAAGCDSISTVISSIALLCVSSIIMMMMIIIIRMIIITTIIIITIIIINKFYQIGVAKIASLLFTFL